ncbi:hypothetical protein E8E13_008948 [Curvularia kusanoi]|uniref:Uncharacterized protein n=1 Tax=Curvularia kusanoi TaxID=90978 RepID=A0A9P4TCQ2_CURKU|nr:hypothetical protein E8E13_008948 [Curvularia kusanoi]
MDLAYASLMSMCTEGTFLYTPAKDDMTHSILALVDSLIRADQYKPPQRTLGLVDPVTCKWQKKVVERDERRGFGVKAEVSGIAAQAPVDLGANAAVGSTAKAGAGLIVSPNVIHKQFDTKARATVEKWIKDNVKALSVEQGRNIGEFGLWIIMATWVTQKCDISMWNKTGKKIDTGIQVGATNIGKLGLNGSREINSNVDEHKVYDEPGGYAVSFSGMWFKPSANIFSSKLKHKAPRDGFLRTGETVSVRIDENGNVIEKPKIEKVEKAEPEPEEEEEIELDFEMVGFESEYSKTTEEWTMTIPSAS